MAMMRAMVLDRPGTPLHMDFLRIQKEGYDEKTVPLDVEGRFMNIEVVLRPLPGEE